MAFLVHTATRADAFVAPLAELLAAPAPDPLATEVLGVPTRGMERWLSQQLAQALGAAPGGRDGICANIEFRFLGGLIGQAVSVPGDDPDQDPWRPERAVWPLIDAVGELCDAAWLGHLISHIGLDGSEDPDGVRRGRRYGVLRHVADLFDRYAMHRPEMVRAWAAGRLEDGQGRPLSTDVAWQARLWREVRARIGVPSLPERLMSECARIRTAPDGVDLPSRVAVVGVARVPASYLQVLDALAASRTLALFVLHPSPVLWRAIRALDATGRAPRRADDPTATLARHPLLGSWGRDAREMQLAFGTDADRVWHAPAEPEPATLLGHLQADIRANRPPGDPAGGPPARLDAADRSIQIHACHGRARQVEVLRDAVLHLFRADPTLQPRDVVVLCPEIETYAPLIEAAFGTSDRRAGAAPALPIEIADRSVRSTNPLVAAVAQIMALAGERVTVTQVRELAALEVVRRRFRFTDDDLQRLEQLVADAGIRWGLDAATRAGFGVGGLAANTWRSGLDRMLVGIAVGDVDDRLVGGVTPLGGLDGAAIDLVGRLAEFVDRIDVVSARFQDPQPVADWVDAIAEAADLLTDTEPAETWQRVQLVGMMDDLAAAAGSAEVDLTPREVRGILASGTQARAGSARYRTGRITISSLIPMRGVPHRVVCLLGLDDAVFPRPPGRDGDDITLRTPLVGDRDPRGDDLQQLLDTVMSATDHLIITYTGHDERTNLTQPPAVPVAELQEVIGRMAVGGLERRVVVEHPLQPFDPRNFMSGELMAGVVWSFDPSAAAGARALIGAPHPEPVFLARQLPPLENATIDLAALVRFVDHPIKEFLSARFGLRLHAVGEEPPDGIPLELAGLDKWAVGDRMLRAARRGRDLDEWAASEFARGTLPPGALGGAILEEISPQVLELTAEAAHWQGDRGPRSVGVNVAIGDGRRVVGTVHRVYDELLLSCGYSRLGPKPRLQAWVRLLVLTLMDPTHAYRSVLIGRDPHGAGLSTSLAEIPPLEPAVARRALLRLVGTYDAGMRMVPTIFTRTSAAYADGELACDKSRRGTGHLKKEWQRGFGASVPGENEDPSHVLVLGARLDFDQLWSRHGDALRMSALELWEDLIAAERRPA